MVRSLLAHCLDFRIDTLSQTFQMEAPLTLPKRYASSKQGGLIIALRRPSLRTSRAPHILVEALTGDFAGNKASIEQVARSGLDVYAHNLETVEARTPFVRDPRATFRQSLEVLRTAKAAKEGLITKTSLMLGVGEEDHQVEEALFGAYPLRSFSISHLTSPTELRKNEVDVVTFGQYMRPTKRHMKVSEYVSPDKFDHWARVAEDMVCPALTLTVVSTHIRSRASSTSRAVRLFDRPSRRTSCSSRPPVDACSRAWAVAIEASKAPTSPLSPLTRRPLSVRLHEVCRRCCNVQMMLAATTRRCEREGKEPSTRSSPSASPSSAASRPLVTSPSPLPLSPTQEVIVNRPSVNPPLPLWPV